MDMGLTEIHFLASTLQLYKIVATTNYTENWLLIP